MAKLTIFPPYDDHSRNVIPDFCQVSDFSKIPRIMPGPGTHSVVSGMSRVSSSVISKARADAW